MKYVYNPLLASGLDNIGTDEAANAGGSNTQIQFNDSGSLGGDVDLTWNKTTNVMTVAGDVNLSDGGSFTTTLQTITPTANRTVSIPDATGTLALVAGSSGQLVYNNAGVYAGIPGSTVGASGNVTLNAASGFSGNLLDLQVNGSSRARFLSGGGLEVNSSSGITTAGFLGTWNAGAIGFQAGASFSAASVLDTFLSRDAAGTLAQRNGTAAQTYRVYNTYTSSTNYELGKLEWSSNAFRVGTEKGSGGGTARALELQTDGTTRATIAANGQTTFSGGVRLDSYLDFSTLGTIKYSANSVLKISNTAETDFNRLQFGGTTSSFPALKRNSAVLETKLADDSAYAQHAASVFQAATAHTVNTLPAAPTVGMIARVTDATAPAVGVTVAGGGSAAALVWYNGTNWTVIGV